jgi:RimJ/RimL family protein N-acetyltransferase
LICRRGDRPIGALAFFDHDAINRCAEFRIIIGEPDARRQGLGFESAQAWLSYGFAGLSLEKVFVNLLEGEVRSIRMVERLGFECEGLLRDEIRFDSSRYNVMRYALLADSPHWVPGTAE